MLNYKKDWLPMFKEITKAIDELTKEINEISSEYAKSNAINYRDIISQEINKIDKLVASFKGRSQLPDLSLACENALKNIQHAPSDCWNIYKQSLGLLNKLKSLVEKDLEAQKNDAGHLATLPENLLSNDQKEGILDYLDCYSLQSLRESCSFFASSSALNKRIPEARLQITDGHITFNNHVYVMKFKNNTLDSVTTLDQKTLELAPKDEVMRVISDGKSTFLITKSGDVLAWGNNKYCRLGLMYDIDIPSPRRLPKLDPKDNVIELDSNDSLTLLLTEGGNVLFCGGFVHQYFFSVLEQPNLSGTPTRKDLSVELNLDPNDKVIQVVVSSTPYLRSYILLRTRFGHVFVWGDNTYGQLGDLTVNRFSLRRLNLSLDPNDKVKHLTSKNGSTFILTECGKVLAFGNNERGQLGLGDYSNRSSPTPLDLTALKLDPKDKVIRVIQMDNCTFLLTKFGHLFACGYNAYTSSNFFFGGLTYANLPTPLNLAALKLDLNDKVIRVVSNNSVIYLVTQFNRVFRAEDCKSETNSVNSLPVSDGSKFCFYFKELVFDDLQKIQYRNNNNNSDNNSNGNRFSKFFGF